MKGVKQVSMCATKKKEKKKNKEEALVAETKTVYVQGEYVRVLVHQLSKQSEHLAPEV